MRKKKNSIAAVAMLILIISVVGKVFGFLRDVLLANYFGTSYVVDAYLMSDSIPGILFGALTAISVGFIPAYYKIEGTAKKNKFLNNTLFTSFSLSTIFIIITYVFSGPIVEFCARGFNQNQKEITETFLRITVLSILLNTPNRILVSYLNCNKQYISSNISNLAVSFTQAIFVVLAAKINIILLPVGAVIPFVIQFIWLMTSATKCGYKPSLHAKPNEDVCSLIVLSVPIFFSSVLSEINSFIDKSIGSGLKEGSISALNYSFTIRAVFVTMIGTIVTSILYPRIAEAVASVDNDKLRAYTEKSIDAILYFIIPINIFFMLFGSDLIKVLLMRGNFSNESLEMTTGSFEMYMLSLLVVVIREIIIRLMYSNSKSRLNLCFACIDIIINFVLSILLSRFIGHIGLALATSIAAIGTFPFYIYELKREIPTFHIKQRINIVLKCLLSTIFAVGISVFFSQFAMESIGDSTLALFVKIIVVAFISAIIYLNVTYLLGAQMSKRLFEKVGDLLNSRNLHNR